MAVGLAAGVWAPGRRLTLLAQPPTPIGISSKLNQRISRQAASTPVREKRTKTTFAGFPAIPALLMRAQLRRRVRLLPRRELTKARLGPRLLSWVNPVLNRRRAALMPEVKAEFSQFHSIPALGLFQLWCSRRRSLLVRTAAMPIARSFVGLPMAPGPRFASVPSSRAARLRPKATSSAIWRSIKFIFGKV